MTAIPETYTEAKALIDAAAKEILASITQAKSGVTQITAAINRLNKIGQEAPNGYLSLKQYIDAEAVANPNDEAIQALKGEMDKISSDFNTISSEWQAKLDALNAA